MLRLPSYSSSRAIHGLLSLSRCRIPTVRLNSSLNKEDPTSSSRVEDTPTAQEGDGEAPSKKEHTLFGDLIKETEARALGETDAYSNIFKDIYVDNAGKGDSKTELNKIFADISRGVTSESLIPKIHRNEVDEEADVNIANSDETLPRGKYGEDPSVIEKEKELFMNIFKTYSQPGSSPTQKNSHSHLSWNLREAMSNTRTKLDRHVTRALRPSLNTRMTQDLIHDIFLRFNEALEPTYAQLGTFESREQYLKFLRELFDRYREKDAKLKIFSLAIRKGESLLEFTRRYTKLASEVKLQSEQSPSSPVLNAYTMPLLFNHIMNTFSTRFYDGQLALTIFNLLKKDLALYSVVCNQATYNEVLKLYWVYYGKLSLHEIEMAYVEMKNNGFLGDINTFRVLKEIIVRYHTLKLGKSGLISFWLREDDKRVRSLERHLHGLAQQLKSM